jgi:hypothetical protein
MADNVMARCGSEALREWPPLLYGPVRWQGAADHLGVEAAGQGAGAELPQHAPRVLA